MTNVGQQLASGTLAGLATTILLQPFDLLKTRVQQINGSPVHHSLHEVVNRHAITETAKEVLLKDGMKGLWRGTGASLLRNVPGIALYMTGVTQLRALMARSPYFVQSNLTSESTSVLPALTNQGNLIAGASARVAVGFMLNPLTILKARYESNAYAYNSLAEALVSIIRQGPSEVLRGFFASSLRDAPYAGVFMIFYEAIKRDAPSIVNGMDGKPPIVIHLFSAASAGMIATTVTHPFDVIKTKMQIRLESRYHKFNTTFQTIWRNRGIAGYFDGLSLRMSRKIFSSAIGWAVYEGILIFVQGWSG